MDGHIRNHSKYFQNIARPPLAVSPQLGVTGKYVRHDTILSGPKFDVS